MSDEVVATCPNCGRPLSAGTCRHCRPDRARYDETIGTDPLAAILGRRQRARCRSPSPSGPFHASFSPTLPTAR